MREETIKIWFGNFLIAEIDKKIAIFYHPDGKPEIRECSIEEAIDYAKELVEKFRKKLNTKSASKLWLEKPLKNPL